ncbi:MAG: hypothetical protein ABIQ93_15745, partial [Saprospiraceae bacterium]
TEKIFRAGNYFFKQTDYCPITENRNMGDTLGWQPVPMLGLEDEASLWEKGGHVFANTLCPHELCGNVFQPAPGATLPPAFFELSPYYFRQIPIDTTSAVLRSTDRELSWDTILINPGFLGSFQKGRQRLFFI